MMDKKEDITYKVIIRPIATDIVITKGMFKTEEDAWNWVEANNCPVVDYDVIEADSNS